jgi:hypothetical protein
MLRSTVYVSVQLSRAYAISPDEEKTQAAFAALHSNTCGVLQCCSQRVNKHGGTHIHCTILDTDIYYVHNVHGQIKYLSLYDDVAFCPVATLYTQHTLEVSAVVVVK